MLPGNGTSPDEARILRFLAVSISVALLLVTVVFALNVAVDPLWKLGGNRLTGVNFGFDERRAKLNQLLRDPGRYDCLIFGSSKTTLLDAAWFERSRCFNLAFSYGLVGEFVDFAEYVAERGADPRLVVIGVDAFNFVQDTPRETVPDFVLAKRDPPGLFGTYVSLDTLDFSRRTLIGDSPLRRYYAEDFSPRIIAGLPPFDPARRAVTVWDEFRPINVRWYRDLSAVFPDARYLVYIPPLSVYELASIEDQGRLDGYADAMYALTAEFDVVYDFAVPSPVTARLDNTYDGAHYDLATNERVARALESGSADFGVRVDEMSGNGYRALLEGSLRKFRKQLGIQSPRE